MGGEDEKKFEGFSKDDPTGPLLQAGAWLEGVNLVSKAIIKEDKMEVANQLLRLEHVATYFLQYGYRWKKING